MHPPGAHKLQVPLGERLFGSIAFASHGVFFAYLVLNAMLLVVIVFRNGSEPVSSCHRESLFAHNVASADWKASFNRDVQQNAADQAQSTVQGPLSPGHDTSTLVNGFLLWSRDKAESTVLLKQLEACCYANSQPCCRQHAVQPTSYHKPAVRTWSGGGLT